MSQSSTTKKDDFKLNENQKHKNQLINEKQLTNSSDRLNCDFKNDLLLNDILDFKKAQLLNSPEVLEFLRDKI